MKFMNEDYLNGKMEESASKYYDKWPDQMEALEHSSALSKFRPIKSYDIYALGKMLDNTQEYIQMCEADGSVGDLGIIPRIAYDVVALSYGTSPIGIVASIQNIEEEQGVVYYKDVVAQDTLGNMTAGQTIFSAQNGVKYPVGYAGQTISENITITGTITSLQTGTFSYSPLRKYTISVTMVGANATVVLNDDGDGNLIGYGAHGTVNYNGENSGTAGAYTITLLASIGTIASGGTTAAYQVEIEAATDVPRIQYELQSKAVLARVYALKSTFGMLKSFALRKRFGTIAEEEAAIDLTNAINLEIFGDAVTKMYNNTNGSTSWSHTAPSGVSYYEHKQTFKDALATAEGVIVTNASRGTLSFIIGGTTVCAIIQTLPGFVKIYDGNSIMGAHLFGTLDGVPVVRVPVAAQLAAGRAILGYKGVSAFEAPIVFAPYMPLTVTSVLPMPNPLTQQRAAAVWAAVDVLVAKFLTALIIT